MTFFLNLPDDAKTISRLLEVEYEKLTLILNQSPIKNEENIIWQPIILLSDRSYWENHIEHISKIPNVGKILIGKNADDAVWAYQKNIDAFMLKSAIETDLNTSIRRTQQILWERSAYWAMNRRKQSENIAFPSENGTKLFLHPDNILFFEASGDYTWCHIIDEEPKRLAIHCGLSKVWTIVQKKQFVRTHRSFIVNPKHVLQKSKDYLLLSNNIQIKIARQRRTKVSLFFKNKTIQR